MSDQPNPSHIMQTATAFWASKVLLTAVEFELFTHLGDSAQTADELGQALQIAPRGRRDFFDALLALGFLERHGDGEDARYSNTPDTATFLDKNKPSYIGGMAEMLNARLFRMWNGLGDSLRTGEPQSEARHGEKPFFEELYGDPERLRTFLHAMSGFQAANFEALARQFDFSRFDSVADIGGALGSLSTTLARHYPNLQLITFDLPPVAVHAQAHIDEAGLSQRIDVRSGDFFADELPRADVITMGNILHDWNEEKKKVLIAKAFEALPEGGALIVIENLIDNARRENAFGLLMSLNMLIEFGDAFDYTPDQFESWCREAGFDRFDYVDLGGPTSAAIAYK